MQQFLDVLSNNPALQLYASNDLPLCVRHGVGRTVAINGVHFPVPL
jgi:hypothetical protein